jgi:cobalt-zinc-cadmium efflux system outer membrane protein
MRISPVFVAATLAALPLGGQAQPIDAPPPAATMTAPALTSDQGAHYSLDDALRVMKAQHPVLLAAQHAIDAARGDRRATSLWQNPVLGAQYYKSVKDNSYDRAGYTTYGVSQFIELSNAPAARARAANLTVWATRADYGSLVIELSMDVQAALIDVVSAQRKVVMVEQALSLLDHAEKIVDQRVAAGATARYDSTRIAVSTAVAHADYTSLLADLARARGELSAAIGPGNAALHGEPDYPLELAPSLPTAEQLVELLLTKRPDLAAARQRAAAAAQSVEATRRTVWSGLTLSALGGFGNSQGQVDVGVGVAVPLPVVDHGQGMVPAAEARARQAQAQVDALLVPARNRLYGMHAEVLTRRRAYDEYVGRAVASGDEMLKEAQAGYLSGRFSVLELVDAYVSWRDSRLRAVDLAAAARNAEVDLSRTLGVRLGR